jgi:LysR family transcriptional regulator of abg operon
MEGLREGLLDLVLSCQPAGRYSDGFQWTELYNQPAALVVRRGHPLRHANSLEQLRDQRWLLQEPLDSSRVGAMFKDYQLVPAQNILECSAGMIYCKLARTTDVISYWPLRTLDYVNKNGTEMEVLNLKENVSSLNISLVYRSQELITQQAKLLADEHEYVFSQFHA